MFKGLSNLKAVAGIYKIENLKTSRVYIGQSVNIEHRVKRHHAYNYMNKNHQGYDSKLSRALRYYGISNFEVSILEECTGDLLKIKEVYWVAYYDSYKNGYNMTEGGNNLSPAILSKIANEKRAKTIRTGGNLRSEKHPRAKLTNEQVIYLRQLYKDGYALDKIYKEVEHLQYSFDSFKNIIFGVSYKYVGNIPRQEEIKYTNKGRHMGPLSKEEVQYIRISYATGLKTMTSLAKEFEVSVTTISYIINYKTYKNI